MNWYEAAIVVSLIPEASRPSSKFNRSKSREAIEDSKSIWKLGSRENSPSDEKQDDTP